MYGRDRERALLRELLDETVEGCGGLVLISGEAGIGKTTLVDDLVRYAEERECFVLTGGCYDLTTTPPHGPWAEVLGGYEPTADGPDLPSWFENPEELEKVGSQAALFEETRAFFVAVARAQPLVIVLEDLHWSDQASLEALRYFSRTPSDSPVLIIVTYRDDEITRRDPLYQLLPTLVRESGGVRVSLQRLNHEAISAVVSSRFCLAAPDQSRLVDYLAQYSEGNPFFLGELLFELESSGRLKQEDGRWQLSQLDRVRLPQMVGQMLERRIQRLDAVRRRHLEIAAVIGHHVDLDLWQGVTNATDDELSETLNTAIAAQLLVELESGEGVRFTHALVREAIYGGIVLLRRRSLHREVAEHLIDQLTQDPDIVADHFVQAGDNRAVDWLLRAGLRAERSYAWMAAANHYESVQAMLEDDGDGALLRGRILIRLSRLLRYTSPQDTLPYLETSLQIARETDDDALRIASEMQFAFIGLSSGRTEDRIGRFDAATRAFEQVRDPYVRARIAQPFVEGAPLDDEPDAANWHIPDGLLPPRGTVAANLASVGRFREAQEMADAFVAACKAAFADDRPGWLAFARDGFGALAQVDAAYGRFEDASKRAHQSREGSIFDGNHLMGGMALTNLLLYYQLRYRADHPAALSELVSLARTDFKRASGYRMEDATMMPGLHWYHWHTGNWDQAESEARLQLEGQGWHYVTINPAIAQLALLDRDRGHHESAREHVIDLLPDGASETPGNALFWPALILQQAASLMALEDGDNQSALAWIEAYHRWLDWSGAVLGKSEGQLLWAHYFRAVVDLEQSRHHADTALEFASEPRQPLALIAAFRFLGQIDVDEEQFDDASRRLQSSLELAERCESPFEQAQTLLVMAELAARTGEADETRRLLKRVRDICEPLGARPTLERAEQIEGMLPKRRGGHNYPAGLTEREVDVLRVVADGKTDAEVAEELFISPRTVSQHLRNAFNKLGVNSRVEATRFAVERGLVSRKTNG